MKTSLIIFGVIFLVIGGIFYFYPTQTASATTTTNPDTGLPDVRTSSASVQIPSSVTYAMLAIGAILLILGFVLGNTERRSDRNPSSITRTTEHVTSGNGRHRRTTSKRTVRRNRR
jgi:hypothetical protein